MLNYIEFESYKKVEDKISLNELGRVNYLVGKNSSGKSSIMEAVFLSLNEVEKSKERVAVLFDTKILVNGFASDYGEGTTFSTGYISNQEIDHSVAGSPSSVRYASHANIIFSNFDMENIYHLGFFSIYYSNYISDALDKIEFKKMVKAVLRNIGVECLKNSEIPIELIESDLTILLNEYYEFSNISDGLSNFYKLIIYILIHLKRIDHTDHPNCSVLCIEEPENFLHPEYQKILPKLFNYFCERYRIQFFVSTHSPFIISAVSEYDEQKVYLLRAGQTCDLSQRLGKGNEGYFGDNCLSVVSNMLGAGLEDITIGVKISNKKNIIYCEGNDDKIYKKIFPYDDEGNENIFVGVASGGSHVINQYMAGKDIVKLALGENCESFFVVDRSNSKGRGFDVGDGYIKTSEEKIMFSSEDRERFLTYYNSTIDGHDLKGRMLIRKEIENYILDPEILDIAVSKGLIGEDTKDEILEMDLDFENGEVKDNIMKIDHAAKIELASLINKNTDVYKELKACIFG